MFDYNFPKQPQEIFPDNTLVAWDAFGVISRRTKTRDQRIAREEGRAIAREAELKRQEEERLAREAAARAEEERLAEEGVCAMPFMVATFKQYPGLDAKIEEELRISRAFISSLVNSFSTLQSTKRSTRTTTTDGR